MKLPRHIVVDKFIQLINKGKIIQSTYGSTKLNGRCPKCNEGHSRTKKRFYCLENDTHWAVYCHNCNYETSFEKMIEELFPSEYDSLMIDVFKDIQSGDIFKKQTKLKKENLPIKSDVHIFFEEFFKENCVKLIEPSENIKLEKYREYAYNKMKSRFIPEKFLNQMFFCFRSPQEYQKYTWRVIIPFLDESGNYCNFQARDIHPTPDEYRRDTKYLFANFGDSIVLNDMKLFGQHSVSPNRTVYICEGLIDSMHIDNAIALCNANVVGEKADFIKKEYPDRIWILDSPWTDKTGYSKICQLLKSGETCFIMPKTLKDETGHRVKDINDVAIMNKTTSISTNFIRDNCLTGTEGLLRLKILKRSEEMAKCL